ncbi:Hypothetical predicted protein [Marmota monax]|uniref:CD83 antigen n=1 Tax=Marmota monax TaxID=9995 RepID=A0A5E4BG39_MARMO|nr:CD83 antigen [Marmota monax]VTJ68617.1 Hypothetical predicted protein [Marmota monax]
MSRGLQLLLLSCACSLAPATREVKVACSETVDLPCTAPWDPQVSYAVSWAKLPQGSEETPDTLQEDPHHGQRGQNDSSEAPVDSPYSLKIKNTATCNSGTYRCTLQELGGQRNVSATVILKVTGEVTCWTCLPLAKHMHALSVGPEVDPLFQSLALRL